MIIGVKASAQYPFTVFKSVPDPPRSSYSMPKYSFPDPLEEIRRSNAANAAARAKAMEIISNDNKNVDGLNVLSGTYSPLRVNIIRRRNGQVEIRCLGIKKNGIWNSCEKEIASLDEIYKNSTNESEKSVILELMEYGNYLLIVNPESEIYIIK